MIILFLTLLCFIPLLHLPHLVNLFAINFKNIKIHTTIHPIIDCKMNHFLPNLFFLKLLSQIKINFYNSKIVFLPHQNSKEIVISLYIWFISLIIIIKSSISIIDIFHPLVFLFIIIILKFFFFNFFLIIIFKLVCLNRKCVMHFSFFHSEYHEHH